MVIETENRKAQALLPPGLVDSAIADAIFADPTPALLLESDGRTPLWSSHEAARKLGYRDAHALMRSRLPQTAPGTHRLAELAAQPDASSGARMEKLRFFVGFRGIALTAVCRLLTLRNGKRALLVSLPRHPGDVSDPHSFGSSQHGVSDITTEAMLRANLLRPLVPDLMPQAASDSFASSDEVEEIDDEHEAEPRHPTDGNTQNRVEKQDEATLDAPRAIALAELDSSDQGTNTLTPMSDDDEQDHVVIPREVEAMTTATADDSSSIDNEAFSQDLETLPGADVAVDIADEAAEPRVPGPLWMRQMPEARTSRRFVFTLDQDGFVQSISPPLADAVGDENAIQIGEHMGAALARYDTEAAEAVTHAITEGETWTGIRLLWPVAHTHFHVPIELSALPLIETDRGLTGYSGFGRCRLDAAVERIPEQPAPEEPAHEDIVSSTSQTLLDMMIAPPHPLAGLDAQGEDEADDISADLAPTSEGLTAAAEEETHLHLEVDDADNDAEQNDDEAAPLMLKDAEEALEADDDAERAPPVPDHQELARQLAALARNAPPSPAKLAEVPNVVSIRTGQPTNAMPGFQRHGLSMSERNAFREIAKALGARFEEGDDAGEHPGNASDTPPDFSPLSPLSGHVDSEFAGMSEGIDDRHPDDRKTHFAVATGAQEVEAATPLLDRLPIGILVLKGDTPLFANRTLLDLTGYADFKSFFEQDGARAIFRKSSQPRDDRAGFDTIVLTTRDGEMMPVDAHLQIVDWDNGKATLLSLRRAVELEQGKALRSVALDLKRVRGEAGELRAILDTATDGVITLDEKGTLLSLNSAAQALFGLNQNEIVGESFTRLLTNESHADALDYLEGLRTNGVRSVLNDGREVFGRERNGGRIPLFMTLGRISDDEPQRFCAVLRDLTAQKRVESELTDARRTAELASAKKSDFLAKISHEIRTPMNAIMGFAEVMQEERLGPLGNAKYKEYLGDIRTSGQHVVSLVNDLLDLAKIEAGRMEMNFAATDVNAIVSSCVGIIQPQANANRVLVRTQLAQKLPPVVADERSIRQIVLNMLSNATRFTESGGQVIVATALLDSGEAVIRIRDTGIGMTPNEIEQALEPFRQVGTQRNKGGTGLGLPLTKALVEANRASFNIRSTPGEGTMVEITFPSTRVLAE